LTVEKGEDGIAGGDAKVRGANRVNDQNRSHLRNSVFQPIVEMRARPNSILSGSFFVALLLVAIVLTSDRADGAPPSAFRVTATIDGGTKVGSTFKVMLRVENPTGLRQRFQTWSCSWTENWTTSDHAHFFVPGWACAKNIPETIEPQPGGSFTDELEVSTDKSGPLAFHMGFVPANGEEIFWSNKLEVRIDTPSPDHVSKISDGLNRRILGSGCSCVDPRGVGPFTSSRSLSNP
jgi:hypothetical protein